jgi:DNA-binding transcriptional MerR regulator
MMSIGELSRRTGVKVPTIRYYEEMGLIPEPGRTESGQRRYGRADLDRLAFIRHARDLGFGIEAIRDLLRLSAHPESPCDDADRIAGDHLTEIRRKIAQLRKLEAELTRMLDHAHGHTIGECRVIEALSNHEDCRHGVTERGLTGL